MLTRRNLLGAATATIAAASAAGCVEALGEQEGAASADPETVRLAELSIQNTHRESHRVQLAVEAGAEMLHLGTYELGADGGSRAVEGEWTETAGEHRIHVALDDGDVRTADVVDSVGAGVGCARVLVRIGEDGTLGVWTGASCGSGADESDLESV
jgi:hypothetical protein